jgi:hypothetical protein
MFLRSARCTAAGVKPNRHAATIVRWHFVVKTGALGASIISNQKLHSRPRQNRGRTRTHLSRTTPLSRSRLPKGCPGKSRKGSGHSRRTLFSSSYTLHFLNSAFPFNPSLVAPPFNGISHGYNRPGQFGHWLEFGAAHGRNGTPSWKILGGPGFTGC